MMRFPIVILFYLVLAAQLSWALSESESNSSRGEANGPFTIPDTITGNLQQDGGGLQDYFRFTATAGQQIRFAATVSGGGLGADLGMEIENASGVVVEGVDNGGGGASETLDWTVPSSGTYYLVVFEATNTPNGISTYNVNVSILNTPPDTAAPTWPGGIAGVKTATRLGDDQSVDLTWYQANDDRTAQSAIRYDIYYSTSQANVFTSGVKATITGALNTTITGLSANTIYYFGVRAKDEANNADTNTNTLRNDPLPNAVGDAWALYE